MDEQDEEWLDVMHRIQERNLELEQENKDLRAQLNEERTGRETWPESLLESVDASGGYTYMVPPPARKWAQGWRRRV